MTEIKDRIIELKRSPMFNMSLSSLELFHSNFLSWLFQTHPSSITILDIQLCESGLKVSRESKNIDLTIESNSEQYFIENKIKDIPNKRQLDEYVSKTADGSDLKKSYILLTLLEASFDTGVWKEVTYKNLVSKLDVWVEKNKTSIGSDDRVFLKSYVEMVRNIAAVCEEGFRIEKDDFWFNGIYLEDELEDIRFLNTIKKQFASHFVNSIEERIENEDWYTSFLTSQNKIQIRYKSDLAQSTPLADFVVKRTMSENVELELIIQIQGTQYRRLIVCNKFNLPKADDRTTEHLMLLIDKTDKFEWLIFKDDINSKNKRHSPININNWRHIDKKLASSATKRFGSYKPDVIYQYVDIAKNELSIPTNDLFNCVNQDLQLAVNLLSNKDYIAGYKKLGT